MTLLSWLKGKFIAIVVFLYFGSYILRSNLISRQHNWRRHISYSYLNCQSLFGGTAPFSPYSLWAFSVFVVMVTVFFYLHIFTGSVGRRILLVEPVATLYRTSIISSSTVLPLNPFVNLSLAPLSLFLTYGPDLGVWPDCWVSGKGSGSTTTTTTKLPSENLLKLWSTIINRPMRLQLIICHKKELLSSLFL